MRIEPTLLHTLLALQDEHRTGFHFLDDDGAPRRSLSFADAMAEAWRHARQMHAAGVRRGDRVALVLPDPQAFVFSFCGAVLLGALPVPLAPPYAFDRVQSYVANLGNILNTAQARLLLVHDGLVERTGALLGEGHHTKVLAYSALAHDESAQEALQLVLPDASDPVFLQFTSGSTAAPKGVRITHGSLAANTHGIMVDGLRCGADDVGMNWLPLFHDMGLIGFVLAPLRHRVPVAHLHTAAFVARPARWAQALQRYRATISFAPNFAYELAVRRTPQPELLDLSHVRVLGCGAEPIRPQTLRDFCAHFAPGGLRPGVVMPSYGMAEATLALSFAPLGEGLRSERIDTASYQQQRRAQTAAPDAADATEFVDCGQVLPGHRVRIVDDTGAELPERCIGHVLAEGPSIADGYWQAPQQTAHAFPAPGLLATGDLGYLADGRLFITGRHKDLIIINGRNIDPQVVERAAQGAAGVKPNHVIAFSVPGPDSELLVLAAAAKAPDLEALRDEVRRHVFRDLSLRVHDIVLLKSSEIPKTSSGKLQRYAMRQRYLQQVAAA